jgi:cytochrome c biogenesis factor
MFGMFDLLPLGISLLAVGIAMSYLRSVRKTNSEKKAEQKRMEEYSQTLTRLSQATPKTAKLSVWEKFEERRRLMAAKLEREAKWKNQ